MECSPIVNSAYARHAGVEGGRVPIPGRAMALFRRLPRPGWADRAARTAEEIDRLLTPEGFDAAAVEALIRDSSLDPAQQQSLSTIVKAAASSPAMLGSALEQVRAVLK